MLSFISVPLSGFTFSLDTTSSPSITHRTENPLNCPRAPSEQDLPTSLESERQYINPQDNHISLVAENSFWSQR